MCHARRLLLLTEQHPGSIKRDRLIKTKNCGKKSPKGLQKMSLRKWKWRKLFKSIPAVNTPNVNKSWKISRLFINVLSSGGTGKVWRQRLWISEVYGHFDSYGTEYVTRKIHSVYNWVTDRVLKLVMDTIFWPILTSVGHYSWINFLENKTILVTDLSPKQHILF